MASSRPAAKSRTASSTDNPQKTAKKANKPTPTPAKPAKPTPRQAAKPSRQSSSTSDPSDAPRKTAKPPASAATRSATETLAADKPRKPKLLRDSFTIPKTEYAVIESLKERAARSGRPAKKSELLRAGIKLLASLDDAAFGAAMKLVPAIKTGRPAKD